MPRINSTYWQYIDQNCPTIVDPRVQITRQMDWLKPDKETHWTGVEPDNYNYAIFDNQAHDIKFIENQCWYKIDTIFIRKKIQGWISVYIIDNKEDVFLFNREILRLQPRAVWRYDKAHSIRPKKTLLRRERQRGKGCESNLTTEERLYQMGYYEKLVTKYYDDEALFKVMGSPRGIVQIPIPEELDYDES